MATGTRESSRGSHWAAWIDQARLRSMTASKRYESQPSRGRATRFSQSGTVNSGTDTAPAAERLGEVNPRRDRIGRDVVLRQRVAASRQLRPRGPAHGPLAVVHRLIVGRRLVGHERI